MGRIQQHVSYFLILFVVVVAASAALFEVRTGCRLLHDRNTTSYGLNFRLQQY